MENPYETNELTIDKIIERFIPVIGAIFLTVGLAYLLYTSVWVNMLPVMRLGLGFFISLAVIGGAFSFSDKLKYFADVTIGAGILLLYGTLIYGSRASDMVNDPALIPEYATLVTAFFFILAIAYFASVRKSKVIIALGMLGSYLTPFVIGQNDTWVQNISFNAYLIYFASVSIVIYLLGKEISVRDIIPVNIAGLFFGTSTLYYLSYSEGISKIDTSNFFSGEIFSAILFFILVILSIGSIILSAKGFEDRDEGYLALGYLAPILWFIFNITRLESLTSGAKGILYLLLGAACFYGWHILKETKTRYQHVSLYTGGILCVILGVFAIMPDINIYGSIAIGYSSLIFGGLFITDTKKGERFVCYMLLAFMGALLSMMHIFDRETGIRSFRALYIIAALLPSLAAYQIAQRGDNQNRTEFSKGVSWISFMIILMYIVIDIFKYFNAGFMIFFIPSLIILIISKFSSSQSHDVKSALLKASLIFFGIGYLGTFLSLVGSIYPAPAHTSLGGLDSDWVMIKGIFGTIMLFLGLSISRDLQKEQTEARPSFILVIFGYSSLILIVNYMIFALMNDLEVPMGQGGLRAILTTIWWVAVAIYMLLIGIRKGSFYRSEKLLGLLLLAITVGKIMLYDLATMDMQLKIVVLMVVGGILMLFSYGVHTKGWLKSEDAVPEAPKGQEVNKAAKDKSVSHKSELPINKKIKDIDVSNIKSMSFEIAGTMSVPIETENLQKIVMLIVNHTNKTTFEPYELTGIYDQVINNYESELDEKEFDSLSSTVKAFVNSGGEVKIIKK